MTDIAFDPTTPTATSTERVRAHRRRKHHGLRLAYLEVRQDEVALCLAHGLLQPGDQDDPWKLATAIGRILDAVVPDITTGRIRI